MMILKRLVDCWLPRKAIIYAFFLNERFYLAVEILVAIFKVTEPLSGNLQGASQDLRSYDGRGA